MSILFTPKTLYFRLLTLSYLNQNPHKKVQNTIYLVKQVHIVHIATLPLSHLYTSSNSMTHKLSHKTHMDAKRFNKKKVNLVPKKFKVVSKKSRIN